MTKVRPLEHLDTVLRSKLKKGGPARDALLQQQGSVPDWLLSHSKDLELGEASPALIHTAKALASPLGVAPEHLPELIALVWEGYGADTSYVHEVPRFLQLADFMIRMCAPIALDYFNKSGEAKQLRDAAPIRDDESFFGLLIRTEMVARMLGDARLFEAQAQNLDDALRVRAVGFGMVAVKHAQTVIEADFDPKTSVPEMRALFMRFLPVLAGARSCPQQEAVVDRAAVDLYRSLIKQGPPIYAESLAKLQAKWLRNSTKAS